ncbi:DUF1761 domain-containing protein [Tateyamaria sp.]|uniref:DUF1761 domain-containing protein n=1 Tax=Tateyamaria sp. TaxID=1929288 RepID=UPI003B221F28
MDFLAVVVAGVAGFMFGAVWYTALAKPWMAASGVALNDAGDAPANQSDPIPYITSIIGAILVAGMMRHVFALSGIDTFGEGLVSGFGVGLFLVSPWIATFYGFSGRPFRLTLIDGGYATFGCTVIGAVLMLF